MSTALRTAMEFLTTLRCPWSVEELADLAEANPIRARAYASTLARMHVLELVGDRYLAGPAAAAWRAKGSKAREGGNAKDYQAKKRVRDELRARDWNARNDPLRGSHCLTSHQASPDNAGDQEDTLVTLEQFYSPAEVADRFGCSEMTVRREISRGRLRAERVGMRGIRIPQSAIDAYRAASTLILTKSG